MEGQFLVRQIYDDEITYNIIGAAVDILSKCVLCVQTINHFINIFILLLILFRSLKFDLYTPFLKQPKFDERLNRFGPHNKIIFFFVLVSQRIQNKSWKNL